MDAEEGPLLKEMSETQIKLKKKLAEPAVLDSFTKLTSDVEKVRLSAGVRLLKHLVHDSDKVMFCPCGYHKLQINKILFNFQFLFCYRWKMNKVMP